MTDVAIGIDIGGTNTVLGLVDRHGNCLAEDSMSTADFAGADAYLEALFNHIEPLLKSHNVRGIGIGAPNGNYYTGAIAYAPNLNWEGVVHLTDRFKKRFGLPAVLTNDANAAAIGELVFGAAKEFRHFIEITIGTGLGSGIVVNGSVLYGHDGFAGEIGHTIAKPGGRRCTCGRLGCLETYVSGRGIKQTVTELLESSFEPSPLRQYKHEDLTAKLIYEAAIEGDKIGIEAFEYTGKVLGRNLADAVAILSPEAIIIFGGLARAGELLLGPTRTSMEKNLLNIYKGKVQVLQSALNDRNAAILGAAALLWNELEQNPQLAKSASQ